MADVERFIRKTLDHLPRVLLEGVGDLLGYDVREVSGGVERFSSEAHEVLEKEGYVIYQLTGKPIKLVREEGLEIRSTCPANLPIEDLPSRKTEVAIKPDQLFLPESNEKILKEQKRMIRKFSSELKQRIKGVEAILGEAPDYVELASIHLQTTGKYLFSEGDNFRLRKATRTKTPEVGACVVRVGAFQADKTALMVGHGHPDMEWYDLWIAPLIVPV